MRYMVLIADSEESWVEMAPDERRAAHERIEAWWGEHAAAGAIVAGDELRPTGARCS